MATMQDREYGLLRRSRGMHGDMNRKFPALSSSGPDFARVARIKAIITDPRVRHVLNLHDGSGSFRLHHQDSMRIRGAGDRAS